MARRRLDSELVRRNLASSRVQARALIQSGRVQVGGLQALKPARQVDSADAIEVAPPPGGVDYVSRGAYKLLGAMEQFSDLIPKDRFIGARALDAGASTGGFTQVLLEAGVAAVLAVDVGYGQLAWSLRNDPRVEVLERTNIRHLLPEQVGEPPSLVVGDMSFISLTKVLPNLVDCAPGATMMLMVKPQFEVGKGQVGAGGVVRDPELVEDAILKVASSAIELGLHVWGVAASPLPGPAGNVEYFLLMGPPTEGYMPLRGTDLKEEVKRHVQNASSTRGDT